MSPLPMGKYLHQAAVCLSSRFPRSCCEQDLDPSWPLCPLLLPTGCNIPTLGPTMLLYSRWYNWTILPQDCKPRQPSPSSPTPLTPTRQKDGAQRGKKLQQLGSACGHGTENVQQVTEHIVSEGCEAPNPACFLDALNPTRIQRLTCEFLVLSRSVLPFWWERAHQDSYLARRPQLT